MSKIYVDQILPKENATISAPNLQLPAGSVVQVVKNTGTGGTGTTSTAWTATNTGATITPKFANSLLVIQMFGTAYVNTDIGFFTIGRNGTLIGLGANTGVSQQHPANGVTYQPSALVTVDEPNTTSPLEYKVYVRNNSTNQTYFPAGSVDQWTALIWEIAQ